MNDERIRAHLRESELAIATITRQLDLEELRAGRGLPCRGPDWARKARKALTLYQQEADDLRLIMEGVQA